MYDNFLYSQVQNTLILPNKIKQEILLHFEKLSNKQIHILKELIKAENTILLGFLKEKKDKGIIPPSEFKWEYIQYRKQKRKILEREEKQKEKKNLEYLLETL